MAFWKERIDSLELLRSNGEHPVVGALLRSRGYETPEEQERFLSPEYDRDIHDPFLFSAMHAVVDRIRFAIEQKERVGIFGDYDADGVTSSVLLREGLTELGIESRVYIPEKMSEGHGLNTNALDFFEKEGVKLVLTLDCGMMNHKEIDEANSRGMQVIIIDHHHVPEVLPNAFAIINPKLPNETYPFQELCGAGTSFKVVHALYRELAPEKEEQLKWLLDVAATGTVADVMPLVGENRVIVKYGLLVLSKTRRVGFQEMFAVGKIDIHEEKRPDARSIGFQIAPRINAASRMTHAMLAHNLLMERDPVHARTLALELEANNTARQKISTEVTELVRSIAEERFSDKKFIFAVDERFPFGIVGLIAGRIAHTFRKPTCVLFRGAEESMGSFRSIPEFNIIEALEECASLLVKYGGHSQAAGMTIRNENLDIFYERFNAIVEDRLRDVRTEPEVCFDIEIRVDHITPELIQTLKRMEPFGEGNTEPVFCLRKMKVENARWVGNGQKHLKLTLSDTETGKSFDAIGFSLGERFPDIVSGVKVDVLFTLDENTWNGTTSVQLKLVDMRVH